MKKIIFYFFLLPLNILAQNPESIEIAKALNLGELVPYQKNDTLPIRVIAGLIVLEANISGETFNLIWDTGASYSALDKKIVEKISLTDLRRINVIDGISNKIEVDLRLVEELSLKNYKVKNTPLMVVDFSAFSGSDTEIHGLLGGSVIKRMNWNFNFDSNYVIVSQKPFNIDGKIIPFEINEYNIMQAKLDLYGGEINVKIDFGNNSDRIELSMKAKEIFKHNKKAIYEGCAFVSLSGEFKFTEHYFIKDFYYMIGGTTFNHPVGLFLTEQESQARIGSGLLLNYNCIINNEPNQLILSERKSEPALHFNKSFGFIFQIINDILIVAGKWHNHPNVLKYDDLNIGDEIKLINGKKATDFTSTLQLYSLKKEMLKNESELVIETKEGGIYKLLPKQLTYE